MKKDPSALEVGQLAKRMSHGYYAYAAAMSIAMDPRSSALVPDTESGHSVPVGYVKRKDGTQHAYHFRHFLDQARCDHAIVDGLEKAWLSGALLAVGDALEDHSYFDNAPELELVRHLRNGVAHGNKFDFRNPGKLTKHPAHNRLAWFRGDPPYSEFEITVSLQDLPVLFEFMGPADVLDLLNSVAEYLIRMGNGETRRRRSNHS